MPILPRGKVLRAAQFAFAAAVVVAIVAALVSQWGALQEAAASARPRWGYVALSCALVIANYALLIQAWRVLLEGWGGSLGFWESARIWTISNLGRYIPGKVWAIGSLAVMAQSRGVSGAAAVGAALLGSLINTVAGFVVLASTGAGVLRVPAIGVVAIAAVGAAILLAPPFLPWLGRLAGRITRRDIVIPRIPHRAIWIALQHVFGLAAGGALKGAGFGTGEAILLVVASRIWLTVLEILPAVIFLLARPLRRGSAEAPRKVASDAR